MQSMAFINDCKPNRKTEWALEAKVESRHTKKKPQDCWVMLKDDTMSYSSLKNFSLYTVPLQGAEVTLEPPRDIRVTFQDEETLISCQTTKLCSSTFVVLERLVKMAADKAKRKG